MEASAALPDLQVEVVEGLGRCAFVGSRVSAGTQLLQERPLLIAVDWKGLSSSPRLLEEALELKVDEEDADGSDLERMPFWSGAALSQAAAHHLLGLLVSYLASPMEVRRAVLELDDVVQNGAALKLLRKFADLVLKHATISKLRKAEICGVFRIIWVNAFPFQSSGAALFSKAACCAHGCRPNAFFTSDAEFGRIVALDNLEQGCKIELCYMPRHYALLPRFMRQRYLRFARGFLCRCDLCDEATEELSCNLEASCLATQDIQSPSPDSLRPATFGLQQPGTPISCPQYSPQPPELHICCCVAPWTGHMLPMLRIARALCERLHICKISFMTDAFGAAKVREWLHDDADRTGKLRVVEFEDGYNQTIHDEVKESLPHGADGLACDVNLLIEANVKEHLQKLIAEDRVNYFIVDWCSHGFSKHMSSLGAEYCISMPTSAILAEYFEQYVRTNEQRKHADAVEATADSIKGRPVLVHCLQAMVKTTVKLPPHIHLVGITVTPNSRQTLEPALQEFLAAPGAPVVYVCLGTLVHMTRDQLRVFADGLQAPGVWRIVWALPEEMQGLLTDHLGPDFFIRSWLPQVEILNHPHVVATLNQCGWGSVCEAITCGKPVCGFPLFGDHSINGAILTDMGMCKIVGQPRGSCKIGHFPLQMFTSEMLHADLSEVFMDTSFHDAARKWQREAASSPDGAALAAELVDGFARDVRKRAEQAVNIGEEASADVDGQDVGLLAAQGFAGLVVSFVEDRAPFEFEIDSDDDEDRGPGIDLPRGAQLDMLLMQSAALLGWKHGVTEWLLRLRVYRDFARFCAHGPDVVKHLDPGDMSEFVRSAGEVHTALLREKVPLGLLSPALDGEPHRPCRLASGLLQVADALSSHISQAQAQPERHNSEGSSDHAEAALELLVSAARVATSPVWWELLPFGEKCACMQISSYRGVWRDR